MRSRDRLLAMGAVLLILVAAKIGLQLYRFYSFKEERLQIVRLEQEIEGVGLGVIESQVRADDLRQRIERMDAELDIARFELEGYEAQLLRGDLTRHVERMYRDHLTRYNERAEERNALFQEWAAAIERNHAFVDRYNAVVDSIRAAATVMGEPYYPVASPAEIVSRREAAAAAVP